MHYQICTISHPDLECMARPSPPTSRARVILLETPFRILDYFVHICQIYALTPHHPETEFEATELIRLAWPAERGHHHCSPSSQIGACLLGLCTKFNSLQKEGLAHIYSKITLATRRKSEHQRRFRGDIAAGERAADFR
jgi:hypothetical protein